MNRLKSCLAAVAAVACLCTTNAQAEGWCDLVPGWAVTTHGTKADNVFLMAQLVGGPGTIWIQISDSTVGKANVAAAMGAQMAGKNLSLYLDAPDATCGNFASWSPIGAVRHVRILN